jgi:predicted adenine nucleotide alpha hydrolase (AANH) superfamily ATPase
VTALETLISKEGTYTGPSFADEAGPNPNGLSFFFYNPNIHPADEHFKRRNSAAYYALHGSCAGDLRTRGIECLFPDYAPNEFFQAVKGKEDAPAKRCRLCYRLRLRRTALEARQEGFTHFSTTLLCSTHQDHKAVKQEGEKAAGEFGVEFLYHDFRPGFRKGQEKARQLGLYRQTWCGCVFGASPAAKRFDDGDDGGCGGSDGDSGGSLLF